MSHEVTSRDLMKTWAPGKSYHLALTMNQTLLSTFTYEPFVLIAAFYRRGHRGTERQNHFTASGPPAVQQQSQDASSEAGPESGPCSSVLSRFLNWEALEVLTPGACRKAEQVWLGWTRSHGRYQRPSCSQSGVGVIPMSSSRLLFCLPCLGSWA